MDKITQENQQLDALQILEKSFESLSSPYLSFHAFVRATNAANELGMDQEYAQIWNHWRENWAVGEVFHLQRLSQIPDGLHDNKYTAYTDAMDDVPFSIEIPLYYINTLLEGFAQKRTETVYGEEHIRQSFGVAYDGLEWDLTGSCKIWDKWRDWEMSLLDVSPTPEAVQKMQQFYLARLKLPHANHADTFSQYSSFITRFDNSQYETHMVAANKDYKRGQTLYDHYDQYEVALASNRSIEAYHTYISHAQAPNGKPKLANRNLVIGLYERGVRDCYPFSSLSGEDGTGPSGSVDESTATGVASIWESYVDWMLANSEKPDKTMSVIERSVKVCPWSGKLWSALTRAHEQFQHPAEKAEETYARALSTGLIEPRIDDLVALVSARASYLRRTLGGTDVALEYAEVAAILEDGLERVKSRDPFNRIEKYAISWHERLKQEDANRAAAKIFEHMTKHHAQKRNYMVWMDWAAFEMRLENYDKVRQIYKTATPRQFIDYPEAIHQAYKDFEEHFGTLESLMEAQANIAKASKSLIDRRMNEAQAYSNYVQQQQSDVAPQPTGDVKMDTAPQASSSTSTKRKAEDDVVDENAKKQKSHQAAENLKRDRENTTVIVSGLPSGCNETDVKLLFKDCGNAREIVVKEVDGQSASTVEFHNRDDVLVALTKDKKRVEEAEIKVVMGWSSTLYVTNFSESTKDSDLRTLFAPYGAIFDTRWPSRSIKTTRRFAYITYLDPASAQASLELNGKTLEHGRALTVAISDPSKRKSRSDDFTSGCEVFVRELGKKMTEEDLRRLFEPFGVIKHARLGLRDDGSCKGFAHVEFENAESAQTALSLNNAELKGKHISVTMSNRKARQANAPSKPRFQTSIRVEKIPSGVKEFVLQQTFEEIAPVKKVWYNEKSAERAAVVEFESEREKSKVLLMQAPSIEGQLLSLSDEGSHRKPLNTSESKDQYERAVTTAGLGGQFVPRSTRRSKIGDRGNNTDSQSTAPSGNAKSQDDFRKFLG